MRDQTPEGHAYYPPGHYWRVMLYPGSEVGLACCSCGEVCWSPSLGEHPRSVHPRRPPISRPAGRGRRGGAPVYWSARLFVVYASDEKREVFSPCKVGAFSTREAALQDARERREGTTGLLYYIREESISFELVDQDYPTIPL